MSARVSPAQELWVCDLGEVPYLDALALQERVRAARQAGELPDTLLLLEHPPVYTLGRRADPSELALPERFYAARGIELHTCDRGGRITYHGPGQLVGYPILAVEDVLEYVRALERSIIAALAREGLSARSRSAEGPDFTGVWVQERKIASIGVHIQRGVSTHGFAVNAVNDLEPFTWIVPCGLPEVTMTSLERELARGADPTAGAGALLERFRGGLLECLCETLGFAPRTVSASQLPPAGTNAPRPAPTRAPLPSPTPAGRALAA
jgi:lipoyl(octanoyl) transferase